MRCHGRGLWFLTLLAVAAGYLSGNLIGNKKPARSAGQTMEEESRRGDHVALVAASGDANAGRRALRSRAEDTGMFRFSLKQWRMLQENPNLLHLDLGECLTWKGRIEVPVEEVEGFGITGFSEVIVDGGPNLGEIAEFFGLDETRVGNLRSSLQGYAERLVELESGNDVPEYRGDGSMAFRFPGSEQEKVKALASLHDGISNAIGDRHADRLWALSHVPEQWADPEIEVSASIHDQWGSIKFSNFREIIFPIEAPTDVDLGGMISSQVGSWNRVAHLRNRIDWERLMIESRSKQSPE